MILAALAPRYAAQVTKLLAGSLSRFKSLEQFPVVAIGIRGYYENTFGKMGQNDRGVYDDALCVLTTDGKFATFNFNTDPSIFKTHRAVLQPGVWRYRKGTHFGKVSQYPAFPQDAPVTVLRDKEGLDSDEKDYPDDRFGINIHRGGDTNTSSIGCQTVPPEQWIECRDWLYNAMERLKTDEKLLYLLLTQDERESLVPTTTLAPWTLLIEGKDAGVPLLSESGKPLAPVRTLATKLKGTVEYLAATRTTLVNGHVLTEVVYRLDAGASTAFAPVRQIGEAAGWMVEAEITKGTATVPAKREVRLSPHPHPAAIPVTVLPAGAPAAASPGLAATAAAAATVVETKEGWETLPTNQLKDFETLQNFVWDREGRITENDPDDPGGATKWGIIQTEYRAYRKRKGLSPRHVFEATNPEIREIYIENYWEPLLPERLPIALAAILFDAAVNIHPTQAIKHLQEIVGAGIDGKMGDETIEKVRDYVEEHGLAALCRATLARRRLYYQRIVNSKPKMAKFLKGWLNRVNLLEEAVLK